MVGVTPPGDALRGLVPAPAPAPERDGLSWQPVPGAAGLLRAVITKDDGRRLTVYRQRDAGRP